MLLQIISSGRAACPPALRKPQWNISTPSQILLASPAVESISWRRQMTLGLGKGLNLHPHSWLRLSVILAAAGE